ncbi:VWA domain-containing protein [Arthrobacter sp. BF1]|uniref:vWA domain-containing protein n=1 Tax=Arthrobacter sp. BF1 TaxID=2821145 RepID=UPI001C4FEFF8|nr:VWA domain-containing protein [Arthrobacter sp. BF1]
MTLLPILPIWLFVILAVLLVAGATFLLAKGATPARWRYGALVLLVLIACARPGLVGASAPVANTELNVYFVVDVTPSVAAEDYNGKSPRLDGMKEDIRALATELAGARFSLLTFDSKASVTMPLTTDATALDTMTQVLTPKAVYISQGSSISVAKQLLAQRLAAAAKTHPERPRLVFYLGDGEQTADSAPEPFKENVELIDGGAVLGYGTAAGGKMREFSFSSGSPGGYILDKSKNYQPAISRIDEKALAGIAEQLQVPYVHREQPENISAALGKASPKAAASAPEGTDSRPGAGRTELYWIFALAAFGVAAWELLSLNRAYRQMRTPGKDRS